MPFKQPAPLLTASEFAKELKISRRHVYRLIDLGPGHGGICAYRFGQTRALRIPRGELERYMGERRVDANG